MSDGLAMDAFAWVETQLSRATEALEAAHAALLATFRDRMTIDGVEPSDTAIKIAIVLAAAATILIAFWLFRLVVRAARDHRRFLAALWFVSALCGWFAFAPPDSGGPAIAWLKTQLLRSAGALQEGHAASVAAFRDRMPLNGLALNETGISVVMAGAMAAAVLVALLLFRSLARRRARGRADAFRKARHRRRRGVAAALVLVCVVGGWAVWARQAMSVGIGEARVWVETLLSRAAEALQTGHATLVAATLDQLAQNGIELSEITIRVAIVGAIALARLAHEIS